MRDGLSMEASFDASSTSAAAAIAAKLQEQAQSLPPLARGLQATSDRRTVNIELQASPEDMAAALQAAPPAAPAPAALAVPAPAAVQPVPAPAPQVAAKVVIKAAAPQPPIQTKPAAPKPTEPQVIHIIGLDDGPREIVLPPVPAH